MVIIHFGYLRRFPNIIVCIVPVMDHRHKEHIFHQSKLRHKFFVTNYWVIVQQMK